MKKCVSRPADTITRHSHDHQPLETIGITHRTAVKLKYPDRPGMRWTEEVLGEDASGEWTVVPAGSPVHLSRGRVIEFGSDQLFCYPRDGWWVAHFWGPELSIMVHHPDGSIERQVKSHPCYVDISTPPVRTREGISFVDLILDVVADEAGEITVLDENELPTANLPGDYLRQAQGARRKVVAAMRAGAPPFDDSPSRWRRRITSCPGRRDSEQPHPAPRATRQLHQQL